ncbi:MAG: LOG family protein [Candidatus Bathyarchaeota archaeon]|nr:LOG family protein [Candidatus Bathyarchaeota archaeon]
MTQGTKRLHSPRYQKKEFSRFSTRLDNFIALADAVVVAPGGVGTLLELFYTWQLLQVKMIQDIPIILLGNMWQDLVRWIKKWPLKNCLLKQEDVDLFTVVDTYEEALEIIKKVYHGTLKT